MIITNDFYDEKEIRTINEFIVSCQFKKSVEILLWEWLQSNDMKNILLKRPFIMYPKNEENIKLAIIRHFIIILKKFILKQEEFSWKSYCGIMHEISIEKRVGFLSPLRQMVQSFFLQASNSTVVNNLRLKSLISKYSNIYITEEFKKIGNKQDYNSYINCCIRTNFPIGSIEEQIIQIEYFHNNGEKHFANFYLPSLNAFLLEIMKSFLEILPKRKLNRFENRLMVTLFEESLGGKDIISLENFNEKTFKQQLFYYNSFVKTHNIPLSVGILQFLIKFYRYIDDIYYLKNGTRLFNSFSFNRDLIIHKQYSTSIELGYEIVNLNSLDPQPKSDKWFVIADNNKQGTNILNAKNSLMDFEVVTNIEFRDLLKKYIWGLDVAYVNLSSHFSIIVDFLNEADVYYQQEKDISHLKDTFSEDLKFFSNRFLIFYYTSLLSNEKYGDFTINYYIKIIRRFLKNIQQQYDVSDITIKQFSTIDVNNKGGVIIPFKDFKAIQKEMEKKFGDGIMLIILQLSIETKIRPGEILALERDCIKSIDNEEKFGIIEYYSKTSGRKKKKEILLMEHIRLLQKAIKMTQPLYEKAENSVKKYIFLCSHSRYDNQVITAKNSFNKVFKNISEYLFNNGIIKLKYTPYNLRHTYIDKAWQMVEDGMVSTLEVGVITGNSVSVAKKHYRNRENTKRYVEALYKVSISDEELPGSIFDRETVESFPPVQNGAGSCASEACVKMDTDEDSYYKCLTCVKFVTTVDRSSFFEKRMKEYKKKKELSTSITERNFYSGLIELYGSYLAEMYYILEGKI